MATSHSVLSATALPSVLERVLRFVVPSVVLSTSLKLLSPLRAQRETIENDKSL